MGGWGGQVSGEWIDEWAGGRKEKDMLAGWING